MKVPKLVPRKVPKLAEIVRTVWLKPDFLKIKELISNVLNLSTKVIPIVIGTLGAATNMLGQCLDEI